MTRRDPLVIALIPLDTDRSVNEKAHRTALQPFQLCPFISAGCHVGYRVMARVAMPFILALKALALDIEPLRDRVGRPALAGYNGGSSRAD